MTEISALIDNSSFAGLMRCYLPEVESHQKFLKDFPEHVSIDYVSLAQILTALCIYGDILVEGSSKGHYDSAADIIPVDGKMLGHAQASNWVNDLCKKLPSEISSLIYSEPFNDEIIMSLNEKSQILSYNLYQSNFKGRLQLKKEEKYLMFTHQRHTLTEVHF